MPYNSDSGLPAHVKKLPAKKRRQWRHVWNSTYERTGSESKAFAAANGVVRGKKELDDMADAAEKSVKVTLYTGADDSGLPSYVQSMPRDLRRRWVSNYNWAVQDLMDDADARERADEYTSVSVAEMSGMFKEHGGAGTAGVAPVLAPTPPAPSPSFFARLKEWLTTSEVPALPLTPAPQPAPLAVYKSVDGRTRVLLTYSNNFRDREKELISQDAHIEYVDAAEAGKALYPDLHLWHGGPDTKWGTVETVSYVDGFAVAGGVVDDGKEHVAAALKELADKGEIAVSFGYYGLLGPDGIYRLYRPFEISPLPVGAEANAFTGVDFLQASKENSMAFSNKKKEWLKTHFKMDDAQIANAEKAYATMGDSLKALGVEFKEEAETPAPTPPPPAPEPTPTPAPTPPPPNPAVSDPVLANALGEIAQVVKALKDEVATMKAAMPAAVEKGAEELVAARVNGGVAGFSPANSQATVVSKEHGAIEENTDDWFAKALRPVFGDVLVPQGGAVIAPVQAQPAAAASGEGAK